MGPALARRALTVLAVLAVALAASACRGRRGAGGAAARNPVKWRVETGTMAHWDSRPIVAADGTIFAVGAPKGENPGGRYPPGTDIRQMSLLVFDADGNLKGKVGGTIAVWGQLPHMWIRQNDAMTAYAVDSSGGVYHFSGAGGGQFRALGMPVAGPPAVDSGGRLYVGGTGLKGLDIGGTDLLGYHWEVGTSWIAAPALDDSGTLFAATTYGGRMYALRNSGEVLWVSRHDVATPVLDGKGRMYVGKDDRLSAIATSNGEMLWQQNMTGPIARDPLIAPDGSIVVVSNAGLVQSYDESGHRKWSFALPTRSSSNMYADASGTLFISDEGGTVHGIGRDGKERWTATVPGAAGTPATGPDGTVYVECANGTFYALSGPS